MIRQQQWASDRMDFKKPALQDFPAPDFMGKNCRTISIFL
jgi:hypothetical protein